VIKGIWRRAIRKPKRGVISTAPPRQPSVAGMLLGQNYNATKPCPECAGPVRWNFTCHTYGWQEDGTGGMACMSCDSAIEFCCAQPDQDGDLLEDGCGWMYTWGLNRRNPSAVRNEEHRPPWIEPGTPFTW
jgi:hypothetical protein